MNPPVFREEDIRHAIEAIPQSRLIEAIEQGFVAYSEGRSVVPPIAEMSFADPPGDVHVKYGYLMEDPYYVIKIASGFYENAHRGLLVSQGLMLLFDRTTGLPLCVLLDNGYLTRVRTAVAGAIAAKYLAPTNVSRIGIVGSGTQARLQLSSLASISDVRDVAVLARSEERALQYRKDMAEEGFTVAVAGSATELGHSCNLIVTTTPSKTAVLHDTDIRAGTHITAVGSDTLDKQELDAAILSRADTVVADSLLQCRTRGEISRALAAQLITEDQVIELGDVISGRASGRVDDADITVADLTGVAVQDIQIAKTVYEYLLSTA